MKLLLFCTLIAVLDVVRGVDVKCQTYGHDDTSCVITQLVTIKTGEKFNIVTDGNLNSINRITFVAGDNKRSQISTVPSEIFEQLPNITTLNLYATVEVLNKGDFEKASNLKLLTIENQLKIIPAGVLSSAKNLEKLTLSDNQIAEIEDNAFSGLNALVRIEFKNNNLTIIKRNTFNGLEKLEVLDLDSNKIETIEENALNLPNLKILSVGKNKLTTLPDHLFTATPLLKHFDAQRNQISHIGKSLYGLKNLEFLSLNYNKAVDVDLLAFSQLPKLKEFFLRENGLTSEDISRIEIKEESKSVLTHLALANNELTGKDDWKKFAIFPQLETIDVQNTKYSTIDLGDKTLRQQFPKLKLVYFSSGKWICDWLQSFIKSSRNDRIHIISSDFSNTDGKNVDDIGCV